MRSAEVTDGSLAKADFAAGVLFRGDKGDAGLAGVAGTAGTCPYCLAGAAQRAATELLSALRPVVPS